MIFYTHIHTHNIKWSVKRENESHSKPKNPPRFIPHIHIFMWTKFFSIEVNCLEKKEHLFFRTERERERQWSIYIHKEINNIFKEKMSIHSQPSILVRLVHSVPHINVTLDRVNSTFDPRSVAYKEVSKTIAVWFSLLLLLL